MLSLDRKIPQAVYPEIKNILFATDFSQCSAGALECLHALAELDGATIHVVHVVSPRPGEAMPVPGQFPSHTVQTDMPVFLKKHPVGDAPFDVWTAHGPVPETLVKLARSEHMDLIALGTHGHQRGAPGLGLVAGKVLPAAPCPVFTVGTSAKAQEGERLERILYATDFSPASLRALPYAISLAEKNGSQLLMTYVDTPEYSADWLVEALYEGKMLGLLPSDSCLCSVEPIVAIGPVAEGVVDTAAEHDADMIVMGFPLAAPEYSREIHARAHCPVLSVR